MGSSDVPSQEPPEKRRPGRPAIAVDKRAVLDAAVTCFAASGLRATTVNAVAQTAGVSKPRIYAHFGDKRELFDAALRQEVDDLVARLLDAYASVEGRSPTRQLHVGFLAILTYARERPAGFRLVFEPRADEASSATGGVAEVSRVARDRIALLVRSRLQRADQPSDVGAEVVAAALVGMAEQAARLAAERDLDIHAVADLLTSLGVGGLAALDASALGRLDGRFRRVMPG